MGVQVADSRARKPAAGDARALEKCFKLVALRVLATAASPEWARALANPPGFCAAGPGGVGQEPARCPEISSGR